MKTTKIVMATCAATVVLIVAATPAPALDFGSAQPTCRFVEWNHGTETGTMGECAVCPAEESTVDVSGSIWRIEPVWAGRAPNAQIQPREVPGRL